MTHASTRAKPSGLAAVIVLTVAVRAGLALAAFSYSGDAGLFRSDDTSTYLAPVSSMLHGAFADGQEPEIRRTPGYPLFLVPGVWLGHVEAVTIALQIGLSAATAFLVYKLGLLLLGTPRAAWWAACFYALEPLSILLSLKLLSETLFTFLFLLSLYCLFHYVRHRQWLSLVGATIVFAASVYVRPTAYYLPVVVGAFLLVGPDRRVTARGTAAAAIFVLGCGGLAALWQIRNQAVAGYSRFSGNEDVNLWLYSLAVVARDEGVGFLEKKAEMGGGPVGYWRLNPEQMRWPLKDRLAHLRARAIDTITRRPLVFLKTHLSGCVAALLNPGSRGLLGIFVPQPATTHPAWLPLTLGLGGLLLATYALAGLGFAASIRGRTFALLLLAAIIGYLALLAGGPIGTSRYRQPLMPLVGILAGAGLVHWREGLGARVTQRIKNGIDRSLAAVGLVLGLPLFAALAFGIWVTLGRPILFRQRRAGLHGRPFDLVKLRTMRSGKGNDETRLTRVGELLRATSLDELPELWNVLRGEMSLVGPRPLPMRYMSRYTPEQMRRHDMKPGLTGWAQVNGRNAISWEDKFAHDVWYVDNWSLTLDARILVKTFRVVLSRQGIHEEGKATMSEFLGSVGHASTTPRKTA